MVKEWFVDPDYQREIERGAFIEWEQTPDAGPGREVMQEILDKIHTRLRPGGAREAGRKSYQGKRRGGPLRIRHFSDPRRIQVGELMHSRCEECVFLTTCVIWPSSED